MTSIYSRIRSLITFVRIPPEMWDFIFPHGRVLKSHAIREYIMAGIVRDISFQILDKEIADQVKSVGAEMVKFASANLINGWEEGDDLCPLFRRIPIPFPYPGPWGPHPEPWGPSPEPWLEISHEELNAQQLPTKMIGSALKILARFTSLSKVSEQLRELSSKLENQRRF